MALVGAGMGCVLTPAFELTTRTVEPRLAGLVAAVTNTSTQLGATIGTAVLNTIAIGATADATRSGASPLDAFVDGLEPRDPSRLSAGDGRPGTRSP
jgi:hypothetical protein